MGCLRFKRAFGCCDKGSKRVTSEGIDRPSPPPQQHSSGGWDSTLLVNETSERIVIREKNRAVWGRDFYKIEAHCSVKVPTSSECGTFVWMGILWGEEAPRPTGITIGFDELASWQQVVFTTALDGRLSMRKVER